MPYQQRSAIVVAAMALVVGLMSSCTTPNNDTVPSRPSKPVALNVLDVAGDLQLTKSMIDSFAQLHPDIIASVTYETAPAADLPGKLQAQQQAGQVLIDLVLTGTDGLSSGIAQGLYLPIAETFKSRLSNMDNYLEPAAKMQTLTEGQGVVVTYYPAGPLLEYNPNSVPTPPTTPEQLLAWAAEHPGRFGYARPADSVPGRTFIMGLPYILGDSNPQDPVNGWSKTWDFLKQLDAHIDHYPTSTSPTMQNLSTGTWDMTVSTTGWDINPRLLGTVPTEFKVASFTGFTWVTDAHYAVVPKGVDTDKQAAILALLNDMLTPQQNAKAFDKGYFYPGPCVRDATLDKAPQESQDIIAQFGRPEYEAMIADNPTALPLSTEAMTQANDIWDQQIGVNKTR